MLFLLSKQNSSGTQPRSACQHGEFWCWFSSVSIILDDHRLKSNLILQTSVGTTGRQAMSVCIVLRKFQKRCFCLMCTCRRGASKSFLNVEEWCLIIVKSKGAPSGLSHTGGVMRRLTEGSSVTAASLHGNHVSPNIFALPLWSQGLLGPGRRWYPAFVDCSSICARCFGSSLKIFHVAYFGVRHSQRKECVPPTCLFVLFPHPLFLRFCSESLSHFLFHVSKRCSDCTIIGATLRTRSVSFSVHN